MTTMLFAQNVGDAVRYSQFEYGGTARNIGVGNTMGAIGADMSAISSNPAMIVQRNPRGINTAYVFSSWVKYIAMMTLK